jgi:hypothetical protein
LRIYDLEVSASNGATTLKARVLPEGESTARELWFRFRGVDGPLTNIADPFAAAMLPFCMHEREPLRIDGALSPVLEQNLDEAQRILASWYDFLEPVSMLPEVESSPPEDACRSGVACCFSGGVDSWYSLLRHRDRITHLFLVHGFDIGLDNEPLWRTTHDAIADVGRALGKPLITCETNLRQIADKRRAGWGRPLDDDFWGKCLHGAALAACTLALGRSVGELIVPATHTLSQLKPWGSSPMLDPYWSSGDVAITHDTCDADRVEKVRLVATSDLALETLRVCHNDVAKTNCGHCEKCLRTMMALRLCGALDRAATFPGREALARLRRLEVPGHLTHHYDILLEAAREAGDSELERTIEVIMGRRFSAERSLAIAVRRLRRSALAAPLRALRRQASAIHGMPVAGRLSAHASRR